MARSRKGRTVWRSRSAGYGAGLLASEETAQNPGPFDLVERDFAAGAVVQLDCARGLVRGHGLGILKGAAGLEIGRHSAPSPA
jgi:hypothetical protein